jgi:hypothetical protein
VLVPGEVGERRTGDLDQLEIPPPRPVLGDRHAAGLVPGELETRGACIASVTAEQPVGCLESALARDHGRGEGQLAPDHREALHVRVRVEKGRPDLE